MTTKRSTFTISSFFLIFCLLFSLRSGAQNLAAFTDYRGNLQVFEGGLTRQLEYLPVKSYKYGGNVVAYIDNKNDFKVYYDGQSINLLNAADFSYNVTNYLVSFKVGNVLYAFDNGAKKTLCYYNSISVVNDSILAYFDDSKNTFSAYYNGKVADLEDSFLDKPKAIKAGANTLAWVNQSSYFNVFYHGQVYNLDNVAPLKFEAGRDLVAYIDDYTQQFHLFYYGDTALVETFAPDSFKVGFGIMAYVDQTGNFRIFDNGATSKVLSDRPEFFDVKGNVIVYSYNNSFNVYYKGQTTTLQNHTPRDFQLGNDGIAWLDDSGRLMIFQNGKISTASYEIINSYQLSGNVLKYEVGNNTTGIFYNGRNY
jgi:hypothetical protein